MYPDRAAQKQTAALASSFDFTMANRRRPPWLRPRKRKRTIKVGCTWYTEEQWIQVKANAIDPDRFEATFAEWLEMAETTRRKMLAAGIITEKVLINAQELQAWCIARGKENDATSRSEYVSERLMREDVGDA